jgi:hypothetical protein
VYTSDTQGVHKRHISVAWLGWVGLVGWLVLVSAVVGPTGRAGQVQQSSKADDPKECSDKELAKYFTGQWEKTSAEDAGGSVLVS